MSVVFIKIVALFTLFLCSSFMVLNPKVKDGVVLKTFLILEALSTFSFAVKLAENSTSDVLEAAVYVSTALVSSVMIARVVKGTSTLTETRL